MAAFVRRRWWAAHAAIACLGFALAAGNSPAAAQGGTASLAGHIVAEANDSVVADAAVIIAGTLLHTATDASGRFRIVMLAPGKYTVRVLRIGFESIARDVELTAGTETTLDLRLKAVPITLAPVTVTASGFTRQVGDVPASQAVVQYSEIQNRNVISLDGVMPFVAGVTVNAGSIDIRGSSGIAGGVGSRVLVLLDGHPLLSADGGEVDFTALPLLDIDRVEVVKGAYSALYGSNALGGVVNVITTPIPRRPNWTLGLRYGVYDVPAADKFTSGRLDLVGGQLQFSQGIGDGGIRLFLDRTVSSGYTEAGKADRWLFKAKYDLNPYSQHPVSAYVVYSDEQTGGFFTWDPARPPYFAPPGTSGDWAHATKLSAGANVVLLSEASRQLLLLPYVEYNTNQNHYAANQDYHDALRLGIPVQYTMQIGAAHRASFGADLAGTGVSSNFLGRPVAGDTSSTSSYHPQAFDAGLFAQDEWALSARWAATVGLRIDAHGATGSPTEIAPNPKLGVVFRETPKRSWRISVARGYRAPSVIEQFVSTVQDGYTVIANPALHGEEAWSAEIGVTTNVRSWLWFDGALFDSEYSGLVGPALFGIDTAQFQNLQRARVSGLDLSTKFSIGRDVMVMQINYMLLYTRNLDLPANFPNTELPYRSRHNLTVTADFLGGLTGVDFRWRSRVLQVLQYTQDPRGDIAVLDLRAGYPVLGTLLQAKLTNALQAKYVNVQERTPGQPRSLLLSATKAF
jgi:outer membrane receptor for ferrienterochelin and colicins